MADNPAPQIEFELQIIMMALHFKVAWVSTI